MQFTFTGRNNEEEQVFEPAEEVLQPEFDIDELLNEGATQQVESKSGEIEETIFEEIRIE